MLDDAVTEVASRVRIEVTMNTKFARIVYGTNSESSSGFCNLGDWFQTFAIDALYERMGIPREDIVNVSRYELQSYDGELVVLPMQGWFGHKVKGAEIFPMSPKIKPVFVGFHCLSKNVLDIPALKKYEPIGCRDEATWKLLTKCGIRAYISGCMTVTFPRRAEAEAGEEVLLIDADSEVIAAMPDQLREKAVKLTQEYSVDITKADPVAANEEKAQQQLARIRAARLVVTSRLHSTGPSLGMGVPVVLAKPYFDERYSWIDLYTPLYMRKHYAAIDWTRGGADISEARELIVANAVASLLERPDAEELHQKVHEMYLARTRGEIRVPVYRKAFVFFHEHFPRTMDLIRNILVKNSPYW